MSKPLNDYSLPALGETITELNRFGSVIAGSLYFLLVAMVLVFIVHRLSKRFLFPRLANKRFAVVLILTLHALVLLTALLLVLGRLGFDTSTLGPVALLLVIVLSVVIFFIAPFLPTLPFIIGNMVEIGGVFGTVKAITPIFTRVQTFDGKTVFIPNAMVWAKNIINYHTTPTRRIELQLRVQTDHSLADARTVLTDIMSSDERVLDDPAPLVRINNARAEGIDMVGLCWTTNADFLTTRSDLYERLVNATQSDSGISLALEKQQVVLSGEIVSR